MLPIIPDFVDHLSIGLVSLSCEDTARDLLLTAWCIQNNGSFADHFGPAVQLEGAFAGHEPPRSLRLIVSACEQTIL